MSYNASDFFVGKHGWRNLSPYGSRVHPVTGNQSFHYGIDYGVPDRSNPYNVQVLTPYPGKVRATREVGSRGLVVSVKVDGTGQLILFQHLESFLVEPGQRVEAGEPVGICGTTGRSTGIHLHFEVKEDDGTAIGGRVWGDPDEFYPEVKAPEYSDKFEADDVVISNARPHLNIRAGPSLGADVVGQLLPGEAAEVVASDKNGIKSNGYSWFKVDAGGWVADQWLELPGDIEDDGNDGKDDGDPDGEKAPEQGENDDHDGNDGDFSALERLLLKTSYSTYERIVGFLQDQRTRRGGD